MSAGHTSATWVVVRCAEGIVEDRQTGQDAEPMPDQWADYFELFSRALAAGSLVPSELSTSNADHAL